MRPYSQILLLSIICIMSQCNTGPDFNIEPDERNFARGWLNGQSWSAHQRPFISSGNESRLTFQFPCVFTFDSPLHGDSFIIRGISFTSIGDTLHLTTSIGTEPTGRYYVNEYDAVVNTYDIVTSEPHWFYVEQLENGGFSGAFHVTLASDRSELGVPQQFTLEVSEFRVEQSE